MSFTARNSETGEMIDITLLENPRAALKPSLMVCRFCGQSLYIQSEYLRGDITVRAHFYHPSECDAPYEGHPESPDHQLGKLEIRRNLMKWYSRWGVPTIEFEVPVPMEWRPKGRIVDVMVTWAMGWREAHEIQLASISPAKLAERTDDYRRAGIDVVWWLGKSADTDANRRFCRDRLGGIHLVDFYDGDTYDESDETASGF